MKQLCGLYAQTFFTFRTTLVISDYVTFSLFPLILPPLYPAMGPELVISGHLQCRFFYQGKALFRNETKQVVK